MNKSSLKIVSWLAVVQEQATKLCDTCGVWPCQRPVALLCPRLRRAGVSDSPCPCHTVGACVTTPSVPRLTLGTGSWQLPAGEAWPASRLSLAGRTCSATCAVVATGATQVGAFKGTASARQGWLWAGRVPSKAECLLARRVLTCKPGFL